MAPFTGWTYARPGEKRTAAGPNSFPSRSRAIAFPALTAKPHSASPKGMTSCFPSGRARQTAGPSEAFPVEVVQFGRGKNLLRGVSFPLRRFGSYAVALEMDRP